MDLDLTGGSVVANTTNAATKSAQRRMVPLRRRVVSQKVLTTLDPFTGRTPDPYTEQMQRAMSSMKLSFNLKPAVADAEVIVQCSAFLSESSEAAPSMNELIALIWTKKHANQMYDEAKVPLNQRHDGVALAYIVAMLMLVDMEIHSATASTQVHPATALLFGGFTSNPAEALASTTGAMFRVFMVTFASSRARRSDGPARAAYRHLGQARGEKQSRSMALLSAGAS